MYKFPKCPLLLNVRVVGAIEGSALHMLVLIVKQSFLIRSHIYMKVGPEQGFKRLNLSYSFEPIE